MKKLLLSLFLMFLPILASAEPVEIDGIWYNLVPKAKEAEVTKNPNGPNSYSGSIEIPASIIHKEVTYSVTSIAEEAFINCYDMMGVGKDNLISISIPNSVKSIGKKAFAYCCALTSANIPNSLNIIENSAFYLCESLKSIEIPNNVTSIGQSAFTGCSSITSVNIPNNVTSIGDDAFRGCSGLTSVVIPNSVTSIGDGAFQNCSGLTSVTIPNSVAYINTGTFSGCTKLTSVTIPNSVTGIGNGGFAGCTALTSITLSNSLEIISGSTFSGCIGLTSITIPNSIKGIGDSAFEGCIGLKTITFPNSVVHIGNYTFRGCSNLISLTFGSNLGTIYNGAFSNCPNLNDVYCYAEDITNASIDTFEGSYIEYTTLHVPAASIEAYHSTEPWSQFKAIVALEGDDIPETKKCATPEISYANGKLDYTCETEGVQFVSEVIVGDAKKYYDASVTLSQTYKISVYAIKAGYENSDVATREIVIENGQSSLFGDLNKDGKVNVADHVKLSKIILNQQENE